MKEPLWLNLRDICAIHNEILTESGGKPGILNKGAIDAALNKPRNQYQYGTGITLHDLAAAYGYGLIKNHGFIDGNKRIALIAVYTFLALNGLELTATEAETAAYFFDLAATQDTQDIAMSHLAQWLRDRTQAIN